MILQSLSQLFRLTRSGRNAINLRDPTDTNSNWKNISDHKERR